MTSTRWFDALNTRLKDYFDLYVLATEVTIDDAGLTGQLARTFKRRGTPIPLEEPAGLSDVFASDAEPDARCRAFLRPSAGVSSAPASFQAVVVRIRELVLYRVISEGPQPGCVRAGVPAARRRGIRTEARLNAKVRGQCSLSRVKATV